ncbi:hypothetical protein LJR039_007566 [Pseudorhodoferax sp. LjRoot39]|uniref:hypothetical protein n=1 Tax=Pseudorhodoferax sp. LjRoot39 TaxID=3342328 RepID=UPI003ECCA436
MPNQIRVIRPVAQAKSPPYPPTPTTPIPPPHATPSSSRGGFLQTFGLDLRVAVLVVIVDMLAFGGTLASLGVLYVVELVSAVVLAFITYRIQKNWYGDTHDSALIKCLIVGLVTAIPAPITPLIAGPGGFIGLLNMLRRK